ncbi:MAG: M3 family oligoendopeptidase, partial [Marinilabiliales bacterium]
KINDRRLQDADALNELLDKLIIKRSKLASNAGYSNYRDYMFDSMGRFDYSVSDCEDFHISIQKYIVPIHKEVQEYRKQNLNYSELYPWDTEVEIGGKKVLKPFENTDELVDKTIECFNKVKPGYGEMIREMKTRKFLDLDSRKGKAPGGFNYPLYESNIPFIYMNATGNHRDMVTMMHEGGHAVHAFMCSNYDIVDFKSTPSEVAELASMSMELLSMDYWDLFYKHPEDLKNAKRKQLEGVISVLPWVAIIDKYQHWLYLNPDHSHKERLEYWDKVFGEFSTGTIAWDGLEKYRKNMWQKQLHIFEVPFYYIEYAMAQLGAVAIWRNYKQNKEQAIDQYEAALKLGYTTTIPEIYKTAGIAFDFSSGYVKELMEFVYSELKSLM